MNKVNSLKQKAISIRKRTLQMICEAKHGHTGGSLSCVDILVALYFDILRYDPANPKDPDRDRFIMSKGHSVESYYCILSEAGFFPEEMLNTYGKFNSPLAGHPVSKIPGVELNSGSLGHGLSVGTGMALAGKMDKKDYKVWVLMGDGEQAEGSVLEATMAASHYRLDNLIAIIDRNRLQISGNTEKIMRLDSLEERYGAFDWYVVETDGNNIEELINVFGNLPVAKSKPHLVIANTTKGKGISFIENRAGWHHKVPTPEQLNEAIRELDIQLENLEKNDR
jgi:transketolase